MRHQRRGSLTAVLLAAAVVTCAIPTFAQAPVATAMVWPASSTAGGGKVVLYEPQIRTRSNDTQLTGVAAVAVTQPGATAPTFGSLAFHAIASADVHRGTVTLVSAQIDATHWPSASAAAAPALDAFARANVQLQGRQLPLETVLVSLKMRAAPARGVPLRTNPPTIFVSQRKALLIVFDGSPVLAALDGTPLKYVANTHSTVVFDAAASRYYLLAPGFWLSAASVSGPWTGAVAPASFSSLPTTGRWAAVHAQLAAAAPADVPHIYVSMQPAALIAMGGPPQFASVPGTQLRYVTNTANDLFFSRSTTVWYLLLAGRWFSAANLNGPWTFASATLPADFKKIPQSGPKGHVLVSVPGTPEADYAGSAARLPNVTPIDPDKASLNVTYGPGDPSFAPIAGTPLQYATNAAVDVIKVGDSEYYACSDAVWFVAAGPQGPWKAATFVPEIVYTIPASSPLYHVTFVHVYNARGVAQTAPQPTAPPKPSQTYLNFSAANLSAGDKAALYSGYSAGYVGGYWGQWGGYAYGTGYYAPGFVAGGGYYYPYPTTYGSYADTTYYAQQQQAQHPPAHIAQPGEAYDPRNASPEENAQPGFAAHPKGGPNNNVYASDAAIYRVHHGAWEKNGSGDAWSPVGEPPAPLKHDYQARAAGYAPV